MNRHEQQKTNHDEMRQIPNILLFFSVGHINKTIRLAQGTANHNYLVSTQKGEEYVVKFPINQTRESLVNDKAISAQLTAVDIGTFEYLKRSDGKFIYDEGTIAVVSSRIDGVHPQVIDTDASFAIGNMLARFHSAVTDLPIRREAWLNPATVVKRINREDDPLVKQARKYLAEGEKIYHASLPSGIIHGDLDKNNLLVSKDAHTKINAILDFEEAEENLLIVDISRALVRISATDSGTKLDLKLMKAFVNGYSNERQLELKELKNLPNAIKWSTGAAMLWYINNGYLLDAEKAISRVENLMID